MLTFKIRILTGGADVSICERTVSRPSGLGTVPPDLLGRGRFMGSNPILGKNITVAFTHIDTTMRGKYQALCMYVMYIYCHGWHFYISVEN